MREFPKKRTAAGALFVTQMGEVLIVKPTYRPDWLIPGGVVEEGESPLQACQREVAEELSLTLSIGRALCIEYQSQSPRGESIQWVFDGGIITAAHIAAIRLPLDELSEARCVAPDIAYTLLNPGLAIRIRNALLARKHHTTIYLEDGKRH